MAGSLILVRVDRLPGDRAPKPVWLWHSHPEAADLDVLRLFHAFLRRFDLEHTFRFLKQTLERRGIGVSHGHTTGREHEPASRTPDGSVAFRAVV